MILLRESIPFSIDFFYQWLVTHGTDSIVVEQAAAAVSSHEVAQILDVSVVQMFLSRTIQQKQQQLGSPRRDKEHSLLPSENEEDDDEL